MNDLNPLSQDFTIKIIAEICISDNFNDDIHGAVYSR